MSASPSPVRSRPRTPTAGQAGRRKWTGRRPIGSRIVLPAPAPDRRALESTEFETRDRPPDRCVDSTATEQGTWITDARHTGHGHRRSSTVGRHRTPGGPWARRGRGAAAARFGRCGRRAAVWPRVEGVVRTAHGPGHGGSRASRAERQRADGKRPRHAARPRRRAARRRRGVARAYLVGMLSPRRAAVVPVGVASAAPVASATARSQLPSPPRRRLAARLATGRATHAPELSFSAGSGAHRTRDR